MFQALRWRVTAAAIRLRCSVHIDFAAAVLGRDLEGEQNGWQQVPTRLWRPISRDICALVLTWSAVAIAVQRKRRKQMVRGGMRR